MLTKRAYGWPEDKTFYVPDEALAHFREALERGAQWQREWEQRFDAYADGASRTTLRRCAARSPARCPTAGTQRCRRTRPTTSRSRRAWRPAQALNAIADALPMLIGGSADLGESNNTEMKGKRHHVAPTTPAGRNIYFGVREHAHGVPR